MFDKNEEYSILTDSYLFPLDEKDKILKFNDKMLGSYESFLKSLYDESVGDLYKIPKDKKKKVKDLELYEIDHENIVEKMKMAPKEVRERAPLDRAPDFLKSPFCCPQINN